jgi:hypothetical protein
MTSVLTSKDIRWWMAASNTSSVPPYPTGAPSRLAHRLGGWSTIRIGKFYNGRDHSTVCHAIKRVETLRRCSTHLERLLTGLTEDIEQIRRSGDRPLPLTVQREIQCVEQIAWTDAVLDALAERIARRIQVALVSGRGEICGT